LHIKDDNPNAPQPMIKDNLNLRYVVAITYDFQGKRFFFSDILRGDIQSVNFAGDEFKVIQSSMCIHR
jgi:hypothetical protein